MGLCQAAWLLSNQHLQLEARLLMFWRGFGIAALVLPAALYVNDWPQSPFFYAAAFGSAILVTLFDRLTFKATAQYGAGITSRLLALCLPLAFLLWIVVHPAHLPALAEKPHIMWLPVALLGTLASVLLLKRDHVSKTALFGLMPLYFLGAGIDVLHKIAMQHGNGMPAFLAYTVIVSATAGIITLFWGTPGAAKASARSVLAIWKGGMIIVIIGATYMLLKTSSINSAPNPAFVTALNLTGPFWVMLWNIWQKNPDNSNLLAGFGCVASALLLVFATL